MSDYNPKNSQGGIPASTVGNVWSSWADVTGWRWERYLNTNVPTKKEKALRFKIDGKEVSIETEKEFISATRLRQLAGVGEGLVLWRRGEDEEGEDVLKQVSDSGVLFPDGNEYYTDAYVKE